MMKCDNNNNSVYNDNNGSYNNDNYNNSNNNNNKGNNYYDSGGIEFFEYIKFPLIFYTRDLVCKIMSVC